MDLFILICFKCTKVYNTIIKKVLILVYKTCLTWVDVIFPPTLPTGFENYIYLVIQKHNENALGGL